MKYKTKVMWKSSMYDLWQLHVAIKMELHGSYMTVSHSYMFTSHNPMTQELIMALYGFHFDIKALDFFLL